MLQARCALGLTPAATGKAGLPLTSAGYSKELTTVGDCYESGFLWRMSEKSIQTSRRQKVTSVQDPTCINNQSSLKISFNSSTPAPHPTTAEHNISYLLFYSIRTLFSLFNHEVLDSRISYAFHRCDGASCSCKLFLVRKHLFIGEGGLTVPSHCLGGNRFPH